jgi:hypothetical protein
MPSIKVNEKALAHLSRGLYRSPASALRELVSNAWDANASEIRISTNFPLFYQMSIQDNGDGFSRDDFASIMEGGIGRSMKRSGEPSGKTSRPVIGRLGIGMLGIAQISGAFTVTSKPRKGKAFRARVRLYDLLKEKLDANDPSVVHSKEVDVGTYDFEDGQDSAADFGTSIITDEVHPTFVRSFQKSLRFEKFRKPPLDWNKGIQVVSGVRSLQELGDYWRLLWELSVSCPIPYVSARALPAGLITSEQRRLEAFKFRVVVDGIELRKPVSLHGNAGGYTTVKLMDKKESIYGRTLGYHGYLLVQEGTQLRPDELRGILIRIKDVGIGYYDPSLLDYRFNEGPRSRWLTGEIFVDEGLEDALNIDRDSFNRFHPEFRALQEGIHSTLHAEIFPESYRKIKVRSRQKQSEKATTRHRLLADTVKAILDVRVQVEQIRGARRGPSNKTEAPIVRLRRGADSLQIELPPAELIETKKSYRQLGASILAIFELAQGEDGKVKQRELFRTLLLKLLERW